MVKRELSNENPAENVEKKKKQPYNNETITLSECHATLLRDIRFGMRFFGEKGRKFFLIGFSVFIFFFLQARKIFE